MTDTTNIRPNPTDSRTDTDGRAVAITGQREFQAEIIGHTTQIGDASLITLRTPEGIAQRMKPGQFVNVLSRHDISSDPLLRRPYSPYRVDPANNTFSLLVRPFGRGSAWLVDQPIGTVLDVMGPLGNGFDVSSKSERILMIAGGVGVAPLVHLTDTALERGQSVTFLMGAATADTLLAANELPSAVEYIVATDDGSQGHHGFVTDLVPEYLTWADTVFACGPDPMLRSLNNVVKQHRFGRTPRVYVSVERPMACGVGVCLGCMVETRRGMVTSCVDGPVYDIDHIVW